MSHAWPVQLYPWQRIPDVRCVKCQQPATGWHQARGCVMFHCRDHDRDACDLLWATTGCDMSDGYDRLRMPWSYWAASQFWYRPKNWLNFKQRRNDARVQAILAEALDKESE